MQQPLEGVEDETPATDARPEQLPPLEIDLELDPPEAVTAALEQRVEVLEAATRTGNEFLLAYGHALKASGRYDEARVALQTCLARDTVLYPYAALLLGELYLEQKAYANAATWLRTARLAFPAGERQIEARFGDARQLLESGHPQDAVAELERLEPQSKGSPRHQQILLTLADAYDARGSGPRAIDKLEYLWARYPSRAEADVAGERLAQKAADPASGYSGPSVATRYRRALNLRGQGLPERSLELLLELQKDPLAAAALPANFTFQLARTYFRAKRYRKALTLFEQHHAAVSGSRRAETLYWRALTTGRLADFDGAVALYRVLASTYPKTGRAETGLYKIGLLRLDQGRYKEAEEALVAYLARYPSASRKSSVLWYIAWTRLRQGHFEQADAAYTQLAETFPDSLLVPGVRYWQGRMALERGAREVAVRRFQAVLEQPVPQHYAALAERWLETLGHPRVETPEQGPLEAAPTLSLPHGEVLARVTALHRVGLRTWAQEELEAYEGSLTSKVERLALADWYRRSGNYGGAFKLVVRMGMGVAAPKLHDRRLAYRLSFPRAYRDLFGGVQVPKNVPMELGYAIMRQESEFKPWVTSRVGARGLMQVIPETTEEVAQARGIPTPSQKQMYRPEVSLQFGLWHLEDLMKRLDGRLPLVVAAYNAGPEAVERWLKVRSADPIDVFIEEISYAETRRYVRKVLGNLWYYRRLYADGRTPLHREQGLDAPLVAPGEADGGG